MKRALLTAAGFLAITGIAEGAVLARMRIDPWKLGSVLAAGVLILGAFVGLTDGRFLRQLRHWAVRSPWLALGLPLTLLAPYLLYALETQTLALRGLGKLTAYIALPTLLLWPDRLRRAERAGWRDFGAMVSLAWPIGAGWMHGIWTWPVELYFFLPLTAVCLGVYDFAVLRGLEGVGYKLMWRKADGLHGLANFAAFTLLALPLGHALHFIRFRPHPVSLWAFLGDFTGIYLTVAIPEEVFFRGIVQNFLVKSIRRGPPGLYGLLIASVVFGLSHLHHPPVPNWRYAIMATLAGIFYGNAYRSRHRVSASAMTHALVDTIWHFWF